MPSVLLCFSRTLCTLPMEFQIIHNLLLISQNVCREKPTFFFSPGLAREHCSLKRSLCSNKLKNNKQAGLKTLAGSSVGAQHPVQARVCGTRCSWLCRCPEGGNGFPPCIYSVPGFSMSDISGEHLWLKMAGDKTPTGVSAFAWPAGPHSILIFCWRSSL